MARLRRRAEASPGVNRGRGAPGREGMTQAARLPLRDWGWPDSKIEEKVLSTVSPDLADDRGWTGAEVSRNSETTWTIAGSALMKLVECPECQERAASRSSAYLLLSRSANRSAKSTEFALAS